jgi:hypothetical protein
MIGTIGLLMPGLDWTRMDDYLFMGYPTVCPKSTR